MTPDLDGKRVLLAGCGVGDRAAFRRADPTDPLDAPEAAFDLVLSHLVLDHVEDWGPRSRSSGRCWQPSARWCSR